MKNLFGKAIVVSILIGSLLTGCTLNQSTEEVMKPPKLSISQEEVLVFYILEKDEEPLRGLVLTKEDEKWTL